MADEKQPIKVWHVEDKRDWQEIVSMALTKAGYQVTTTGSATEAKKMIPDSVKDFKAAVLDGNLGDGNGKEIAVLLRTSQLPISIIGLASENTPWADAYVSKVGSDKTGFEKNELLSTLAELIGKVVTN